MMTTFHGRNVRVGERLSRKRFVKLLMCAGISRNDAIIHAAEARDAGLPYALYIPSLDVTSIARISSLDYPYAALNMKIDWRGVYG